METGTQEMRTSGRTTRQANELIEELFIRREITVEDHAGFERCHQWLIDRILRRLKMEHQMVKVKVDRNKRTIKII